MRHLTDNDTDTEDADISDEAVEALMDAGDLLDLLDYEDWRPSGLSDFDAMYDPEDYW